jgi:hypothetical protein
MPPRDAASSRVSGLFVVWSVMHATQVRRLGGAAEKKLELVVDDVQDGLQGICPTTPGPFSPKSTAYRCNLQPGLSRTCTAIGPLPVRSSTIDKSARSPTCKRSRNLSELDAGNGSRGRTGLPLQDGRQTAGAFLYVIVLTPPEVGILSPNQRLVAESCRPWKELGHPTSRVCRMRVARFIDGVGNVPDSNSQTAVRI